MNVNEWHDYFEHTGQEWVNGAYNYEGYSYPVGYHRLRVLKKILKNYNLNGKKVLDIGCGGGDISFYVASLGAVVDGVDMTETMLEIANERRSKLKGATLENVHFHRCEFHSIGEFFKREKFDYIIAFGLIGYIETDNLFFETVSELCHLETVLVLSCRNRLFNITSITPNTIAEIQQENAIHLIEEIDRCWQKEIPIPKQVKFVQRLKGTVKHLDEGSNYVEKSKGNAEKNEIPGTGPCQPRQSSPEALKTVAKEYGFIPKRFFGVHPHLLLPRLNRKLPPKVFNALSDALCVFEDEPISLVYSSVFVAEMVRR